MPCTTILAGKKATNDGSTMIARTDDGFFDIKKLIVTSPQKQPRTYKSVNGHLEIKLPDDPVRYTSCPSVDTSNGVWPASGINEFNVGMTATETITSNPRVLGADPYVEYKKASRRGEQDQIGGIGEEDLVLLVLPYIRTAREGVLRLGALLKEYGTYEPNGIAFNDENEVWWLETIGGHHWIARRVADEEVVLMPNRFGLDKFDMDDAFGEGKENLCSEDLREFIADNYLDLNTDGVFNPRYVFGSHTDTDHIYNTPRAWFMGRYINPNKYRWDGPDADFGPESDDIPWALVPEKKITVEDIKYLLSSYFQGTPYDPYQNADVPQKGHYRTIGINRTGVMVLCQIRGNMPEALKGVEWLSFGSTTFGAMLPVYTAVNVIPKYLSDVTTDVDSNNFYWASRLIGALADPHYGNCIALVERYHNAVANGSHRILNEYDAKMRETGNFSLTTEANRKLCEMAKRETQDALNKITLEASKGMRNGYNRADN